MQDSVRVVVKLNGAPLVDLSGNALAMLVPGPYPGSMLNAKDGDALTVEVGDGVDVVSHTHVFKFDGGGDDADE